MNAVRPLIRPAPASLLSFNFTDVDVSELSALAMYFDSQGRHSLVDECFQLIDRIKVALGSDGVCLARAFSFSDYGRLMNWRPFAAVVSPSLELAVIDLAERIWCGLTGDERCPVARVKAIR